LGFLPGALPPLDGLFFYDAGLAWSHGQSVSLSRPPGYDVTRDRVPLRSYGFGLRLNLFNYAILRWDYAIPVNQAGHKGLWTWSLWPSF
jgi:outer membrane protein assembly factor BamA